MRVNVLIVFVFSAAFSCLAGPAATNAVSSVASVASATNAPRYLPSEASFAKQSGYSSAKVSRQQCEAVTKSGNRCKRNAVPGGELCRQHQRIIDRGGNGG